MSESTHTTTVRPTVLEFEHDLLEVRRKMALAAMLAAAAALIVAVVLCVGLLWLIVAAPKATAFDADGVRCYRAAFEMSCIKTAEPAR